MLKKFHAKGSMTYDELLFFLRFQKRNGLRLVVSSATVDAEELRDFFNSGAEKSQRASNSSPATILSVEGRLYPINIHYVAEPVADYVKAVVDTAIKINESEDPGDVLAFLTGMEEVDRAVSLLNEHAKIVKEGKRRFSFKSPVFKNNSFP